jgi:hypothetical protein
MPPEKMSEDSKQKVKGIFAEYDRTQKTYSTMGALHTLAQYWVENEIIIEQAASAEAKANEPKWTPNWDDEAEVSEWHWERDTAREMHDKTLIPMHRYSCIVMLCATIEKELLGLVKNLETERGPQKLKVKDINAKPKLAQISKFCEVFYGVRLLDCTQANALTDLQKIRDCIVHCAGDVGLLKDAADIDFLVKLKEKRRGFFAHPNNDIYIEEECIKQFLVEIWAFYISVFGALGWEIASHWNGNKLERVFEKLKK